MESGFIFGGVSRGPIYFDKLDGSRVMVVSNDRWKTFSAPVVVSPPTVTGYCTVWWPIVASVSISSLLMTIVLVPPGRRLLARGRLPRLTMLRGMVAIGVIAADLWLYRINGWLAAVGAFVLILQFHSAYRRRYIANSGRLRREDATVISRLVVVGYAIAAALAVAWFGCIYFWDVLQIRPR